MTRFPMYHSFGSHVGANRLVEVRGYYEDSRQFLIDEVIDEATGLDIGTLLTPAELQELQIQAADKYAEILIDAAEAQYDDR